MATQKQVQILATYYHKTDGVKNGTVSYLVRSSDGKSTYCTTLVNGKASGCTCPSRSKKGCYHKHQLEAKEAARKEAAEKFAAKSVPTWTMQLVASGKLVAPAKAEKPVKAVKVVKVAKTEDITTKGNLNGTPTSTKMPAWLAVLPSRQALAS